MNFQVRADFHIWEGAVPTDRPAVVVPAPGVPKPSHLESKNSVYQRNEFPGARRFSHLGGKPPLFNDGFAVRALHKSGCSAAYDISCGQLIYNHLYLSPLEKVVFEKNLCPADTSVRGKSGKWHFFKCAHILTNYCHIKKYFFLVSLNQFCGTDLPFQIFCRENIYFLMRAKFCNFVRLCD